MSSTQSEVGGGGSARYLTQTKTGNGLFLEYLLPEKPPQKSHFLLDFSWRTLELFY
jgi:hypothetical protein